MRFGKSRVATTPSRGCSGRRVASRSLPTASVSGVPTLGQPRGGLAQSRVISSTAPGRAGAQVGERAEQQRLSRAVDGEEVVHAEARGAPRGALEGELARRLSQAEGRVLGHVQPATMHQVWVVHRRVRLARGDARLADVVLAPRGCDAAAEELRYERKERRQSESAEDGGVGTAHTKRRTHLLVVQRALLVGHGRELQQSGGEGGGEEEAVTRKAAVAAGRKKWRQRGERGGREERGGRKERGGGESRQGRRRRSPAQSRRRR